MTESVAPKKPDRTWLYVGVAFAAIWGLYLAFFNPKIAQEGPIPPQLSGTGSALPADYGWALEDLHGKPVSFGDFRGRPIVLNLWATWCPPCREEMPSLVRLAADPRLKGVAFVCVTNEPVSPTVIAYAEMNMKGLTVLRAPGIPIVFAGDGAIPATYIITHDGAVVASEVGSARWDDPSVVAFVEGLLKRTPAKP